MLSRSGARDPDLWAAVVSSLVVPVLAAALAVLPLASADAPPALVGMNIVAATAALLLAAYDGSAAWQGFRRPTRRSSLGLVLVGALAALAPLAMATPAHLARANAALGLGIALLGAFAAWVAAAPVMRRVPVQRSG